MARLGIQAGAGAAAQLQAVVQRADARLHRLIRDAHGIQRVRQDGGEKLIPTGG